MKVFELDRLEHLRDWLSLENDVYQPIQRDGGNATWEKVEHGQVAPFDAELRPLMSPKSLFFAEQESMFVFDGEMFRETLPEHAPQALFGVKSCDLTAIAYQDIHFKEDPHYQQRRQKTLLVGIDCLEPCESGFCATVDSGPQVKNNIADLILAQKPSIGNDAHGWWVICASEAGEAAIAGMNLRSADNSWMSWREMSLQHTLAAFKDDTHIINGIQRINGRAVPEEHWDRFAHQCISCSGAARFARPVPATPFVTFRLKKACCASVCGTPACWLVSRRKPVALTRHRKPVVVCTVTGTTSSLKNL